MCSNVQHHFVFVQLGIHLDKNAKVQFGQQLRRQTWRMNEIDLDTALALSDL